LEKENVGAVHPFALQGQHRESDLKNAGNL
jgi:hypothetical protein